MCGGYCLVWFSKFNPNLSKSHTCLPKLASIHCMPETCRGYWILCPFRSCPTLSILQFPRHQTAILMPNSCTTDSTCDTDCTDCTDCTLKAGRVADRHLAGVDDGLSLLSQTKLSNILKQNLTAKNLRYFQVCGHGRKPSAEGP